MNEITKIHLGRQAFTIAVEAYAALKEYLDAIKHQVGPKGADVVEEVELRIAELLAERGVTGDKVILTKDVDYVKKQLGKPGDFSDSSEEAVEEMKEEKSAKHLFRDTEHGMIAGVAAGLAAYLNVDAVFVRIGFIVMTLLWGWGIALYLVLWLIVPELKTKSDRLRAQGKAVTVDSLKIVVERADVPGATRRVGKVLQSVVQICLRLVLVILGIGFALAGVAGLLGVMTTAAFLLLRSEQAFQADLFLVNGTEVLAVALGLLAAAAVAAFLLLMGTAMLRRKWTLPGWVAAALAGVLLVSVATGTALVPGIAHDVQQRHEAAHHTSKRTVDPFTALRIMGNEQVQVSFVPAAEYSVDISYFGKADPSLLTTKVADGKLTLDTQTLAGTLRCKTLCLYYDGALAITVHAPSIQEVDVTGQGTGFTIDGPLTQPSLTLSVAHGAYANGARIYAQKAAITKQSDTVTRLILTNLLPDTTAKNNFFVSSGYNVTLGRTNELYLTTRQACGPSAHWVHVIEPTDKIVVNDTPFAAAGDLRASQLRTTPSSYNCILAGIPEIDLEEPID